MRAYVYNWITFFKKIARPTTAFLGIFAFIASSAGCDANLELDGNETITENTPNEENDTNTENADDSDAYEDSLIAELWLNTEDPSTVELIADRAQLDRVLDILVQWEESEDEPDDSIYASLAGCGGYWGNYYKADKAEYQSSGYSYYWSPNCYMEAGPDCGDEWADYMVSFWLGPDYTTNMDAYRTYGESMITRLILLWKGGGSFRLYTSDGYGNAYVCLPWQGNPEKLRFGRDY